MHCVYGKGGLQNFFCGADRLNLADTHDNAADSIHMPVLRLSNTAEAD